MSKEIKSLLGLFFIALTGYIIQFSLNTFLARHLSEAIYGDFNLAIKVLTIFVAVTLFGSNVGANRFLAKFIKQNDVKAASDYIAWNTKLLSITFIISFLISILVFVAMLILHKYGVKHINKYHLVVYTLWLFPFATISLLFVSYLSSANQVHIANILMRNILYIVQLVLFALIILFLDSSLQNISIIFVVFLSYFILSGLAVFFMNPFFYNLLIPSLKRYKTTSLAERNGQWIKISSRLMLNGMLYTLVCAVDLVIIEIVSNNEADVGFYSAALVISGLLWVIFEGLYNQLKTEISSLLSPKGNPSLLQKKLNTTHFISFAFLIISIILIVIFEKQILLIFGPSYINAETVVTILCIRALLGNYSGVGSRLLILGGLEKTMIKLTIFELLFSAFFMITLTYFYGIIGTSVAALITSFIKLMINVILCRRAFSIRLLSFI